MFKERYRLWIIVMAICLLAQFLVHTAVPGIITGLKNCAEEYSQKQEQIATEKETADLDVETDTVFGKAVRIILTTGKFVGVLVLLFGVFNFVLGSIQENDELRYRGVSNMVIGSVLVALSTLVPSFDLATTHNNQEEAVITESLEGLVEIE